MWTISYYLSALQYTDEKDFSKLKQTRKEKTALKPQFSLGAPKGIKTHKHLGMSLPTEKSKLADNRDNN